MHAADSHDLIRVHGARVNNLKDVSIELPKRRLTVFTGVSGSGKSSLVFGTIAAESQRLINETYSAFVQGFMPTQSRPEVDVLDGLTTAIIVDQQRMGGDPRSTVGTATDANAMLRILFSRLGKPHIGSAKAFSFNTASISGAGADDDGEGRRDRQGARSFSIVGGMCPRCEGRGAVSDIDLAELYDETRSINDGAITVPGYSGGGWNSRLYAESGFFDPDKPIKKFTKKELHDFLHQEPTRMKIAGINMTYEGLIPRIQKSMLSKERESLQPHIRAFVDRAVTFTTCPDCDGTRLSRGRAVLEDQGHQHRRRLRDADQRPGRVGAGARAEPSVAPLLAALSQTLDSFVEIGLGYLSLSRSSGHAVRRRGAAREDDPAPGLLADRRHLRLRRAHRRPAPARHPADERAAAAAARQGQHGAGRGAQAGADRDRRPRGRPRAGRRVRRRRGVLRGDDRRTCGAATPSPDGTWTTGPR